MSAQTSLKISELNSLPTEVLPAFFLVPRRRVRPRMQVLEAVLSSLLAFFGTNGDVANEEDLELLKSSIKRQRTGPSRVDTAMIQGADHMYVGQEDRVAQVIASWADTLLSANTEKRETPKNP